MASAISGDIPPGEIRAMIFPEYPTGPLTTCPVCHQNIGPNHPRTTGKDHTTLRTPLREIFNSIASVNALRTLHEVNWTRTEQNVMTAYAEMLSDKARELGYR